MSSHRSPSNSPIEHMTFISSRQARAQARHSRRLDGAQYPIGMLEDQRLALHETPTGICFHTRRHRPQTWTFPLRGNLDTTLCKTSCPSSSRWMQSCRDSVWVNFQRLQRHQTGSRSAGTSLGNIPSETTHDQTHGGLIAIWERRSESRVEGIGMDRTSHGEARSRIS